MSRLGELRGLNVASRSPGPEGTTPAPERAGAGALSLEGEALAAWLLDPNAK